MVTQAQFRAALTEALNEVDWGVSKANVGEILDVLSETIVAQCKADPDGKIAVQGLGRFTRKKLPRRKVRNPATGETMWAKASVKLRFSPQKSLREALTKR